MTTIPGYSHVARLLHDLRQLRRRDTWRALCPAHSDRRPSLHLWIGRKGNLLANCWACGRRSFTAIANALRLPPEAFFPDFDNRRPRKVAAMRKHDIAYPYVSADGEVLYEKLRYSNPKDFRIRRPDPKGGWIPWLDDATPRVLYRLPDLLDAFENWTERQWVWLTEGEKDADNLWNLGFVATTNYEGGGAGKWLDVYSQVLSNHRVLIVEDNDLAGRERTPGVLSSLLLYGATAVKVLRLPGLAEHGDVSDWLADFPRGVSASQKRLALIHELRQAPAWAPLPQLKGDLCGDCQTNRTTGPNQTKEGPLGLPDHATHRSPVAVHA